MAHFDFELPDACTETSRDRVSFSGIVEICVIGGKSMLQAHFEMYPVGLITTGHN